MRRTNHSKIVLCRAANVALRHNRDRKTSSNEDENGLQEVQPNFTFLDIALWYPPYWHLRFGGPLGGARGALLWTIDGKVLCLRRSALAYRPEVDILSQPA